MIVIKTVFNSEQLTEYRLGVMLQISGILSSNSNCLYDFALLA